jgi:hypothetical protein
MASTTAQYTLGDVTLSIQVIAYNAKCWFQEKWIKVIFAAHLHLQYEEHDEYRKRGSEIKSTHEEEMFVDEWAIMKMVLDSWSTHPNFTSFFKWLYDAGVMARNERLGKAVSLCARSILLNCEVEKKGTEFCRC